MICVIARPRRRQSFRWNSFGDRAAPTALILRRLAFVVLRFLDNGPRTGLSGIRMLWGMPYRPRVEATLGMGPPLPTTDSTVPFEHASFLFLHCKDPLLVLPSVSCAFLSSRHFHSSLFTDLPARSHSLSPSDVLNFISCGDSVISPFAHSPFGYKVQLISSSSRCLFLEQGEAAIVRQKIIRPMRSIT